MKKKLIIILLVILGLIAARYAISFLMQLNAAKAMKATALPPVTVGEIKSDSVQVSIPSPARIVSQYRVDVVARINGYLTKSYFKEGDFAKKGQVLFEIEPQQWLYEMEQAKANVDATRAKLIYAEKQLKRTESLLQKDYVSKASYDEMLSNRDNLKSQLALYQAKYKDAQRNYSYTHIKAPVSGRVGMIETTVGNYVSGSKLTTIYSDNPIYVTFPLSAKTFSYITKVDKGVMDAPRKVELFLSNGDKYEYDGVQEYYGNSIDEASGSLMVRATFKNPDGKLINGDYGSILIYTINKIDAPVVPQTAVMENPQGKYVYKMGEDNIPKIAYIQVQGQDGKNYIIESGLEVGDKIITGGIQKVIPNKPVRIVNEEELAQLQAEDKEQTEKKER
ncbi:efflux RND transporter periplasmic adaptor subunit [bacterium]|nr:efflux RND transporter periplasmic adaptor subunit [bacterium]